MSLYEYMLAYRPKKDGWTAFVRGSRHMTFGRLRREVERVAGGLAAMGVKRGDVVMLALPTMEQGIVAFYAVSRLGAVASMIHPLMARGEFERAVAEQRPKVVFLSDINFKRLGKGLSGVKRVVCPFLAYGYLGLPRAVPFEPYSGDGSEPAVYMRSGGTSGDAKTVVLSASAVNALTGNLLATLEKEGYGEKDRMLTALPMFHGFGLFVGLHTVICIAAAPVLMPVFKADKAVRAIARNRVTLMIAVPGMVNKLLLAAPRVCGRRHRGRGARTALRRAYARGGDGLRAFSRLRADGDGERVRALAGQGGRRGARKTARQHARSHRGRGGERGARGRDGATAATYTEIDGEKWLKTGDMFRATEDGSLYFMGRKKRLIKISGVNVFPAEIERAAVELPFVGQCAAIEVREHNKPFIALFVTGKPSEEQVKELKRHIVNELSKWHEPRYVIHIDALPRTQVGKTDHVRLSDEFESCRKKSS